jgi:O-antigen/teichoic acid export membrane protein
MVSQAAKSVTRNVAVLSFTRVITTSSTLLLMMFLPRCLGAVGYGRLYLGQSITAIFALLIEFGGNYSIMKAVARHPEDAAAIFVNSLGVRLFLWAAALVLMVGYAVAVHYPTDVILIVGIFGVSTLWSGFNSVLGNCFRGADMMKYPSYGAISETVFTAAVGITALLIGIGPVGYALISVVGTLSASFVMARFRSRLFTSLPKIDWTRAFAMLREGLPYFLNTVFGVIYYRIDTVMLSLMTPEQVVGWYGAAYRFFDSLMVVPVVFTVSIFPVMSRRWGTDAAVESLMMQKSLDVILMTAVPMSIGAFFFSPQIIHFFFGTHAYEPSILILKIFSVGIILLYLDFVLGTVLLSSDRQKQLSRTAFTAIFVNVGLNYLMIPFAQSHMGNGGVGSAIATLVTELFVMINMLALVPAGYLRGARIGVQLKTLGAGAVMIAALWISEYAAVNWIVCAVLGSAAYVAALWLLKTFSESDKALARTILGTIFPRLSVARADA